MTTLRLSLSPMAIKDALVRVQFSTSIRIALYESIALQLDNGMGLIEALEEIYYGEAGTEYTPRKPPSINKPTAVVVYDCITAVRSGRQLSDALEAWVSPMEVSLLVAGERTGSYLIAFERAILALNKKGELASGLWGALAYPVALGIGIPVVFGNMGRTFAPQLLAVAPIEKWDLDTGKLLRTSLFFSDNALLLIVGALLLIAGVAYSFGNLTGRLRDRLDRVAPWSIYRLFVGSVFLLNVAVMLNCGIGLEDSLVMLLQGANPYLRERITNVLRGVRTGRTFGDSLHDSEHQFPSEDSVRFIRRLSNKKGFDQALERYTLRSLNQRIKSIKQAASFIRLMLMLAAGFAIQMIAKGLLGIASSASAMGGH